MVRVRVSTKPGSGAPTARPRSWPMKSCSSVCTAGGCTSMTFTGPPFSCSRSDTVKLCTAACSAAFNRGHPWVNLSPAGVHVTVLLLSLSAQSSSWATPSAESTCNMFTLCTVVNALHGCLHCMASRTWYQGCHTGPCMCKTGLLSAGVVFCPSKNALSQ